MHRLVLANVYRRTKLEMWLLSSMELSDIENLVPLKSGLQITQGYWKWHHSIDHIQVPTGIPWNYGPFLYHFWDSDILVQWQCFNISPTFDALILTVKKSVSMFIRFDKIHKRDRQQTDKWTDRHCMTAQAMLAVLWQKFFTHCQTVFASSLTVLKLWQGPKR